MENMRVGVLRGGPCDEYEVSLKTGTAVLRNLPDETIGVDVFIGRDGTWHVGGVPMKPGDALSRVDVAWNALHGAYGEDGTVQRLLETFGAPYTGSGPHASFLGMNKERAKAELTGLGFRMPQHRIFRPKGDSLDEAARAVFGAVAPPWIIKPLSGGSSLGIVIARTFPELASALTMLAERADADGAYIIEEMIRGKEATVGIIDDFRGEEMYALPPTEIRPPKESPFFDYDAKYSGRSDEICPGNFSRAEKEGLAVAAKLVHKKLGLRHYSRSDFIVAPSGIYFLEVNTLPGLTEESLFPKALRAVGSSLRDFVEHTLRKITRR